MALLHLYAEAVAGTGQRLEAVTVDHGLRSEAADEARLVAEFCARRGIDHSILPWTDRPAGGNLMAAAREARYRLMADWGRSRGIGGIALGHTADDVAETFLMRLGRRAGVDGLSLMETRFDRHGMRWARPLWQHTRAELRDYLTGHGITWAEDPTNHDPTYDRTRARAALAALTPLGIDAEGLKDVAVQMLMARTALEHYSIEEARRLTRMDGPDLLIERLPRPPMPPEIQRRLLVGALQWTGGHRYPPRGTAIAELDAGLYLVGKHTLAGCLVTLEDAGQTLRIAREHAAVSGLTAATEELWDGRWKMTGPHAPDLHIAALGEGILECPDWRETGLPRASLLATPAVWRGDALVAAPCAGQQNGWTAQIVTPFSEVLLSR